MLWNMKSVSDKDIVSLHDCRAVSAELVDDQLKFCLPEEIFYQGYGDDWPNTGTAAAEFSLFTLRDTVLYFFETKEEQTGCREYTAEQSIDKISSKELGLPIVTTNLKRLCRAADCGLLVSHGAIKVSSLSHPKGNGFQVEAT